MQRSEPDLPCISDVQDDGAEEQTLIFQYGSYRQAVLLTDEERERLAYGDWKGWVEFVERVTTTAPSAE